MTPSPATRSSDLSPRFGAASYTPPDFMFRPVRTRLLENLLHKPGSWPKLLGIVAPVGYGKTVLMSELHAALRRAGEHCYWIGLNERHASVDHVLNSLQSARGAEAEIDPTQALMRGDEPIERRIDDMVERIASLAFPVTIFIDNLNSCTDAGLGGFLDALLFRTPPSIRFVWSSTTVLNFNVGRAKLAGLMREVGYGELSLDDSETRALLGPELERRIGDAGVEAVHHQTEGWPAAVRMAQIVLAEAPHPLAALEALSGIEEDLSALLTRQVVSGFPASLREFLWRLAQLRTFSAALCQAALGCSDVDAHLAFLLQRNVFMIPLDRKRSRYRLHSLFREYLLEEARRNLPAETCRAIQERAADWHEQRGDWHDAIDYALDASADVRLRRLLDRAARHFVREQGDVTRYIAWVEQVLHRGAAIGWETHFWYVWALIFQRRYEYGVRQHEILMRRLAEAATDGPPPEDLKRRMDHLRICIDLFSDRFADAYQGIQHWLVAHASNDPYSIASIGCMKSICLAGEFKLPQAWEALRTAQPVLLQIGGADTVGWSSLIQGILLVEGGDYGSARQELAAGLARLRQSRGDDSVLSGTMALVGAKCAVEMRLDDEARQLLDLGLRTLHNNVLLDTVAWGIEAAIKLWNGDHDERISIARLRDVARSYPPRLARMLSCFLVRRLVQLGRIQDALLEADRLGLLASGDRQEPTLPREHDLRAAASIELLIATGRLGAAEALVAAGYRAAQDANRAARLVDLDLDRATLALEKEHETQAAKALANAICRAAPRQIVRPFFEHGTTVKRLVQERKASRWSFALPAEREFFEHLCKSLGMQAASSMVTAEPLSRGTKPTTKEAELLALLEMGLSNQEIADRIQVSITTVKWHLRNLYKKLGVSSRNAALARARGLTGEADSRSP